MKNSIYGITFLEALGLIFIVLKLTNVIDWSWWLVLLPIYGPFAFFILLVIFVLSLTFLFGSYRNKYWGS